MLQETYANSIGAKLITSARILTLLTIFCLPFSHFWVEKLFIAIIALTLFAGNWKHRFSFIKHNWVAIFTLLLFALFIIGLSYSQATLSESLQGLGKYGKIFMILFALPLFTVSRWRKLAVNSFIIAVIVSLLFSYLQAFKVMNLQPYFGVASENIFFIDTISYSVLLAFTAFILLHKIVLGDKSQKIAYSILFLFVTYYLFFINVERTGYLIFIALAILFIWQQYKWKGLLLIVIVIPLMVMALYMSSTFFKVRVDEVVSNIISYQHGHARTSIGYRLAFIKYSLEAIKQHPILGTGTGSFATVYQKLHGIVIYPGTRLGDPHNEYLLVAVQLGAIGLALFLLWIIAAWFEAKKLPAYESALARGLVITFVINSFGNVSLTVNTTGFLYVIFIGVLLAARYDAKQLNTG